MNAVDHPSRRQLERVAVAVAHLLALPVLLYLLFVGIFDPVVVGAFLLAQFTGTFLLGVATLPFSRHIAAHFWRSFAFQVFAVCAATAIGAVITILVAIWGGYLWFLGPALALLVLYPLLLVVAVVVLVRAVFAYAGMWQGQ